MKRTRLGAFAIASAILFLTFVCTVAVFAHVDTVLNGQM